MIAERAKKFCKWFFGFHDVQHSWFQELRLEDYTAGRKSGSSSSSLFGASTAAQTSSLFGGTTGSAFGQNKTSAFGGIV